MDRGPNAVKAYGNRERRRSFYKNFSTMFHGVYCTIIRPKVGLCQTNSTPMDRRKWHMTKRPGDSNSPQSGSLLSLSLPPSSETTSPTLLVRWRIFHVLISLRSRQTCFWYTSWNCHRSIPHVTFSWSLSFLFTPLKPFTFQLVTLFIYYEAIYTSFLL